MAHDVFISYSTRDKSAADAACHALEARGIRCWIAPRDIPPGSDWSEQIIAALDESRTLVIVFSSNANQSKQVMRELSYAADRGIPILPLRIEDVLPSKGFSYYLGVVHWLDALSPPLEMHLEKLTDRIFALLEAEEASGLRDQRTPQSPSGTEDGTEKKPLQQYRENVKAVWSDKELTKGEAEWLRGLADRLGLSPRAISDVEREVMGDTKEAILEGVAKASLKLGGKDEASSDTVPEGESIAQDFAAGTQAEQDRPVHVTVSSGKTATVPDVSGRSIEEARRALSGTGFVLAGSRKEKKSLKRTGTVVSTEPSAGSKVALGTPITPTVSGGLRSMFPWIAAAALALLAVFVGIIVWSSGGHTPLPVPDLVNQTQNEAEQRVERGFNRRDTFEIEVRDKVLSESREGIIVSQYPKPGEQAEQGSKLSVLVSSGTNQGSKSSVQAGVFNSSGTLIMMRVPTGWRLDEVQDAGSKASMTVLGPDREANVIASSEGLDSDLSVKRYAESQGELLREEFPGFREADFRQGTVFGGKSGYVRQFEWSPPEGAYTVTQIQIYYAEGGQGYTATATTDTEDFERYESQMWEALNGTTLQ